MRERLWRVDYGGNHMWVPLSRFEFIADKEIWAIKLAGVRVHQCDFYWLDTIAWT